MLTVIVYITAMNSASVSQGLPPTSSPFQRRMTKKYTESAERESQNRIASRVPTVTNSAGALTEKHTYHPLRMLMNQRSENVARETVRSFASRKLTAMSSDIASQEMIPHFLLSLLRKMMTTQISRHADN
jgi:hypothetical protein